jgi:peptide/nickel transport system permease protein
MSPEITRKITRVRKQQTTSMLRVPWWLVEGRWRQHLPALIGSLIIVLFVATGIFAPWLAPSDPLSSDLTQALIPPGEEHLLGTDLLGREVLSRLIFGARLSLLIGVGSVLLALIVALVVGTSAGFLGGRTDLIIMRLVDIGLSFPTIFLALLVVTVLGTGLKSLVPALAFSAIFPYARLIRSAVLTVKNQEYIIGARTVGCSVPRIILRHVLPNSVSPIIVHSTFEFPRIILAGAGLSFLGLGVERPLPEWGAMLAEAKSYLALAPYLSIAPGLALMAVVIGFNLFGDGLRDILDPKIRRF